MSRPGNGKSGGDGRTDKPELIATIHITKGPGGVAAELLIAGTTTVLAPALVNMERPAEEVPAPDAGQPGDKDRFVPGDHVSIEIQGTVASQAQDINGPPINWETPPHCKAADFQVADVAGGRLAVKRAVRGGRAFIGSFRGAGIAYGDNMQQAQARTALWYRDGYAAGTLPGAST